MFTLEEIEACLRARGQLHPVAKFFQICPADVCDLCVVFNQQRRAGGAPGGDRDCLLARLRRLFPRLRQKQRYRRAATWLN